MIDPKKQYRTRDGCDVRIYAVDGGVGANLVFGAVKEQCGHWHQYQWYPHGGYLSGIGDPRDLIEVKPRIKRKVWMNVYSDGGNYPAQVYLNQQTALLNRYAGCIACVEIDIDVEEGHGL